MIFRRLLLASVSVLSMGASIIRAEDFSTGKESWTISSVGELKTANWPIDTALSIVVLSNEKSDDKKAKEKNTPKPPPAADPKTKEAPVEQTELQYGSDRNMALLAKADSGVLILRRSLRFDPERRAIRVLDIISGSVETDMPVKFGYKTRWKPDIVPSLTKLRKLDAFGKTGAVEPSSEDTAAGFLISSRDPDKLPVVTYLIGAPPKNWKRSVQSDQDSIIWGYDGVLHKRERLVLLHWLVLRDDAQADTMTGILEGLVDKSGLPIEPSLGEDVVKELANYPIAAKAAQTPAEDGSPGPVESLHLVNTLADRLKVTRSETEDVLRLSEGLVLKGTWKMEDLQLKVGNDVRTIASDSVAAIEGGAGRGRQSRVFFRDGSVHSGELTWASAEFASDSLGTLKLTPQSVDILLLRVTPNEGTHSETPLGWLATESGDVLPCRELKESLTLRSAAGSLHLPWKSILTIKPSAAGDTTHQITLKNGSTLVGWCAPSELQSLAEQAGAKTSIMSAWASDSATLAKWTQGEDAPAGAVSPNQTPEVRVTDGSVWRGSPGSVILLILTASGRMELPMEKIRQISRVADSDADFILFKVILVNETTLQGRPEGGGLEWKVEETSLVLPWFGIESVLLKQEEKAP